MDGRHKMLCTNTADHMKVSPIPPPNDTFLLIWGGGLKGTGGQDSDNFTAFGLVTGFIYTRSACHARYVMGVEVGGAGLIYCHWGRGKQTPRGSFPEGESSDRRWGEYMYTWSLHKNMYTSLRGKILIVVCYRYIHHISPRGLDRRCTCDFLRWLICPRDLCGSQE